MTEKNQPSQPESELPPVPAFLDLPSGVVSKEQYRQIAELLGDENAKTGSMHALIDYAAKIETALSRHETYAHAINSEENRQALKALLSQMLTKLGLPPSVITSRLENADQLWQ